MLLQKGQKIKIEESLVSSNLDIVFTLVAPFDADISCFGLDSEEKLSNEAYMIFYNQKSSPQSEIQLISESPNCQFTVNLSKLPSTITKLVFTAAIDPSVAATMKQLSSFQFKMNDMSFNLSGGDFNEEKAIMIVEFYKKDNVWRLGANGQGFNGGLEDILKHFGGTAESESPANMTPMAAPTVKPQKISLEKLFEEKAPQLVSLAKKATISLEKNGLSKVKAKVAFIIDASGSMIGQYRSGQVQQTLNRVFPLGVHFDDDEELETWAFALKSQKLSNITFNNYQEYVNKEDSGWNNWMSKLNSAYNNEPAVIIDVIKHFTGLTPPEFKVERKGFLGLGEKVISASEEFANKIDSKVPVVILFISDGGVAHNEYIEYLIKWSSTLPIFWQFIGIGGSNYGALEKLDNLSGRYLDNADFFSIDKLNDLTESELYDKMMGEFPHWLKAAHAKGLIDNYTI